MFVIIWRDITILLIADANITDLLILSAYAFFCFAVYNLYFMM